LRRIEERGAVETAHRVRNYCGAIFRYAIQTGRAERDPSCVPYAEVLFDFTKVRYRGLEKNANHLFALVNIVLAEWRLL